MQSIIPPCGAITTCRVFLIWSDDYAWSCPEEVEQIARFKDLTDVQRSLLLSARKEPGKYVEGVVLSDNLEALFRNVPPPLSLALAMTEKHEKAERAAIMREQNCNELEAVYVIAKRIALNRGG